MKAIMKTIKPKTCANIMNLIQSILVIKNKREADAIQKLIDENGYTDIYVYCRKDNKTKLSSNSLQYYVVDNKNYKDYLGNWNGKVLFKFRCYNVEEIKRKYTYDEYACVVSREWLETNTCNQEELSKKTCLTKDELFKYLGNKTGYAIHISNLEIFDDPKELSEFKQPRDSYGKVNWNTNEYYYMDLINPPKNFCYMEVE